MNPESILYNSWSEKYRKPFGSIRIGETVRFTIRIQLPNIQKVNLIIQRDSESWQEMAMSQNAPNAVYYTIDFQTGGPGGLYFYYFQVMYVVDGENHTLYYGKAADGCEGPGEICIHPSEVRAYQLTCYQKKDPAPDWYLHGTAYQIFVDRFYNGNRHGAIDHPKKNSFIYATKTDIPYYIRDEQGGIARWDFYGGNLAGIIKKLSYLHRLGVSILYLSPIFEARSNHKYDTGDYDHIDPMFGDETIFRKLISKARRLGIRIILDGVFNHVGADSRYFNQYKTYGEGGAYQDPNSPYYHWFTFNHYPDSYNCWWGIRDLPAVNHKNSHFRSFIYGSENSVIHKWTSLGIGGWRLDVADELPDDFIAGIRQTLDHSDSENNGKVLIGEVWEDASNKVAYHQRRHYIEGGMLHGVMNYPFRSLIIDFLLQRISPSDFVRRSLTLKSNYPPHTFQANLNNIGTHDTERILTVLGGNLKKLRLAVELLMTLPGVPCVYYGDEAGLTGGKDPDNRRYFPWGHENQEIEGFFYSSIKERRMDLNLQEGDFLPFVLGPLLGYIRIRSAEHFSILLINVSTEEASIQYHQLEDPTGEGSITMLTRQLFTEGETVKPLDYLLRCTECKK